ncbi:MULTISPECIES: histidine phosphatase family protein [Thermus]|jgi:probable phosphoglycerate mutase|uniref:Phosphoglycerate mutase n=1 Tax=Thermus brockianus TaxID=56956 RepID=A0A1J0LYH5_THEBO|nr:histidine phosphatase family protein [Thermus brockianus]APD10517.1 phosphoglycerate mutase family protein [Thermus brockianus]BDG17466.1 phosphoglycerate mutase [Thermus brockianus]
MRRRLLLLRHGEVDYFPQGKPVPPQGVGLTERGRRQAEAVGRLLRRVPLDLALHTGLPRTEETLALVLKGRPVPVEAWPDFQEIRPGRLKDLEDPERAFREAFHPKDLSERFLGGERYGDFLDRVLPAYERLLARPWNTALLVAHGGVIRALLTFALTGQRGFLPLEVHPCGLSVLDLGERPLLRLHNLTPYDPLPKTRLSTMEALWLAYQTP